MQPNDAALELVRATDATRETLHAQNAAIRPSRAPEPIRTLAEWLTDPGALEPPPMIIPYLALAGRVTLLAAKEKVGKSTFMGQCVAAFSQGAEFLGQPCGPGKVLWYALDEAVLAIPFGTLTKVQAVRSNVDGFRPFRIPRISNVSLK